MATVACTVLDRATLAAKGALQVAQAPSGEDGPAISAALSQPNPQLVLPLTGPVATTPLAPLDLVEIAVDGTAIGRWKYEEDDTDLAHEQANWSVTLLPLGTELSDVQYGHDFTNGASDGTDIAQPVLDAVPTTKHCTVGTVQTDGDASRQLTFDASTHRVLSTLQIGIGLGGLDWWWWCSHFGVVEMRHGARRVVDVDLRSTCERSREKRSAQDVWNRVRVAGTIVLVDGSTPMAEVVTSTGDLAPAAVGYRDAPSVTDSVFRDSATCIAFGTQLLAKSQAPRRERDVYLVDVELLAPGDMVHLTELDGSDGGLWWVREVDYYPLVGVQQVVIVDALDVPLNPGGGLSSAWRFDPILPPVPVTTGGTCCGGEVLMAEAFTADDQLLSGTVAQTLATIPITVDTPNTRIRVVANVWITEVGAGGRLTLTGPNGSRTVRFSGLATNGEDWRGFTWEVPGLAAVAQGDYNVTLALDVNAGPPSPQWTLGYQVLVWLETSG